ncbi:prepilin-type N-terminal cleavage/methylation domain-containing protein [Nocardioides sp. T2.26MG-1]|uniref:prepilin-type N-terminal cleavage/methylation domain-containing protein n=1 Tax=Nocardioides sp. T2.26MG-1 TaxID=3041166 RepID=UPI002540F2C6|nr:prepilin-type N-terminal cleavage/methylation domain-containing protein [Nocardioides sp. T2.26MG-1]
MQKSLKEKDQGFTLIELLVVIVIIGILAAIAIPIFLNQQKKGIDSSLKSDLKSAATTVETWVVDNPSTDITGVSVAGGTKGTGVLAALTTSDGNTVTLVKNTATTGAYCIFAYNTKASKATGTGALMMYDSMAGGLQKAIAADQTCDTV